jgi:hypothetical protein
VPQVSGKGQLSLCTTGHQSPTSHHVHRLSCDNIDVCSSQAWTD